MILDTFTYTYTQNSITSLKSTLSCSVCAVIHWPLPWVTQSNLKFARSILHLLDSWHISVFLESLQIFPPLCTSFLVELTEQCGEDFGDYDFWRTVSFDYYSVSHVPHGKRFKARASLSLRGYCTTLGQLFSRKETLFFVPGDVFVIHRSNKGAGECFIPQYA